MLLVSIRFAHPANMNEQLIDELRARAVRDAAAFRERHPGEQPTLKWVENSYTAALPLASDDAGANVAVDGRPDLFAVYREEIAAAVGGIRPDTDGRSDVVVQQPTPGEHG
jgi:hypothetical protein